MQVLIIEMFYDCHPETCSHINHLPWCVIDRSSNTIINKFYEKEDAEFFCIKHNFDYTTE